MPKLGLASWRVGDVLRLGPIGLTHHGTHNGTHGRSGGHSGSRGGGGTDGPPPAAPACGVMVAELGYLVRRGGGQGAFEISCAGSCACVRKISRFRGLFPFPTVQTDTAHASDSHLRGSNLTVTVTTAFLVLWSRVSRTPPAQRGQVDGQCAVHLTHRATPSSDGRASRVRIDSLVLTHWGYPPTGEWNYALKWAPSSQRQIMTTFLERHGGKCALQVL